MKRLFLSLGICLGAINLGLAGETSVTGKIESLSVFKNGIAVVREQIDVPGEGRFLLGDLPEPIHGTFFVESDADVTVTATEQEKEVPLDEAGTLRLPEDLIGQRFRILLPSEKEEDWFRVVSSGTDPSNKTASNLPYSLDLSSSRIPVETTATIVLEREKNGERVILGASQFNKIIWVSEQFKTVKRKKPALIFDVRRNESNPPSNSKSDGAADSFSIRLTYLTKGMAWAPSYRVEMMNTETLDLEQTALVMNEWRDFDAVPLSLISGYPRIPFENVPSPLAPNSNITRFFEALTAPSVREESFLRQNAVLLNQKRRFDDLNESQATPDFSTLGKDLDLYFQETGLQSIARGDRIQFSIDRKSAPYRKVVRWDILDQRDPEGRYRPNLETNSEDSFIYGTTTSGGMTSITSQNYPEPWDVLVFRNPFDFPMTTGVATVWGDGHFYGQNTLFWVNPNEETSLPVTKSLSVRVRSEEEERKIAEPSSQSKIVMETNVVPPQDVKADSGEITGRILPEQWGATVRLNNNYYRIAVMDAEITIENQRNAPIEMIVRRRFTGERIPKGPTTGENEVSPKETILADGPDSFRGVNRRNELEWDLHLKPNEKRILHFSYQIFIPQ